MHSLFLYGFCGLYVISPCVVDENVDVKVAARRIAWGRFMNSGTNYKRLRLWTREYNFS